jgi:predicted Zn-dependent peptidase
MKKTYLKNKLRVIIESDPQATTASVLVLTKTGSWREPEKLSGISHFLEHMLFKGTKNKKTARKVAETLDKIGGSYNAFTSEEFTGYYAKVSPRHAQIALNWVEDIFCNSTLPSVEAEKEKGVIIEEINMRRDNPMSYVQVIWPQLLYGDQPAGRDIAGTKESVKGITRKDLMEWRNNNYTVDNTILVLTGNWEKVKIDGFQNIRTGKGAIQPKVVEKQTKPAVMVDYRETDQTHFCLGVRAFPRGHADKYVLKIISVLLGGMMSSRLFSVIRDKLGLAYYIHTSVDSSRDAGYLVTQAGVDNKRADEAIKAIWKEYLNLVKKPVSNVEIKKAKEYMKGHLALSLETSSARGLFYGTQELLEDKVMTRQEIEQKIEKVTVADVQRVAKKIFKPSKLNLTVVGPFKNKKIL